MADLPTNLKDDILNSSVNTRRKYRMIENGDGTYSFEDVTEYNQVGDEYGAGLINETNRQVNERVEKAVVVRDLETIGAITQEGFIPDALALRDVNNSLGGLSFGYDSASGKYGYWKEEAGTEVFVPFRGTPSVAEAFGDWSVSAHTPQLTNAVVGDIYVMLNIESQTFTGAEILDTHTSDNWHVYILKATDTTITGSKKMASWIFLKLA